MAQLSCQNSLSTLGVYNGLQKMVWLLSSENHSARLNLFGEYNFFLTKKKDPKKPFVLLDTYSGEEGIKEEFPQHVFDFCFADQFDLINKFPTFQGRKV